MFKISTKNSVKLSLVLSLLFFGVILAGAFILPGFVNGAMKFPSEQMQNANPLDKWLIISLGYMVLIIAAFVNAMLFKLLLRVKNNLVFTEESISLTRIISWCVILLGLVFLALGWYFLVSYFAAFACIFLGICIRVVKNVIERATEIKTENDFTI